MKQFAIAGMQRRAAVFLRIGPVMIHWRKGMSERQARHGTTDPVRSSETQKWLDRQWSDCRPVKRHQLKMFVRLAGSGLWSGVVNTKSVDLGETDEEGFAVFL